MCWPSALPLPWEFWYARREIDMIHIEVAILFVLGFSAVSFSLGILFAWFIQSRNSSLKEELPPIYIVTPKKDAE